MLQIQTTNLPQDQQLRLHPDFLANEQAYLLMRDGLLAQYRGQWVAVDGGKVLVAGAKLMEVMEAASTCGGHPYIALVGAEDTVVFRVRRAVFAYDQGYQSFPLPRVSATCGSARRVVCRELITGSWSVRGAFPNHDPSV
jgi:hypothetical protein